MAERRYIVQLLERQDWTLLALANDGTVWKYDAMFNAWEPACANHERKIAEVPQPDEDPWL